MDPSSPLLYIFLSIPLFPLLLLIILHTHKPPPPTHKPTTLKSYPLIGHLPHFITNSHRFIDWTTDLLLAGPTLTVSLRSPLIGTNAVVTADPVNVEHVLKANFVNYPKGDLFTAVLGDFLGHGIFNADGDLWKSQRQSASFEFNVRTLRDYVADNVRREISSRLLPLLRFSATAAGAVVVVDLQDVLQRFAFDSICKVTFGEDPACLGRVGGDDSESADFMRAFDTAAYLSADRFMYPFSWVWRIKRMLNVGSESRLRESISTVHDFAAKIIRSRKNSVAATSNEDLLSRFDSEADEKFLRDVVVSFILAGRETTSSALTWFFWLLSTHPEAEKKILEEVRKIRSRNQNPYPKETFSFDELKQMHYLHAAISESLRLFPPVAIDTMTSRVGDVLPDGTEVGKGWFVTYNAYAMGRSEEIWGRDCGEYRPERWISPEGVFRPESSYKFLAFHGGPRTCLGKEMAYLQMKSVAACVVERFEIDVVGKEGDGQPEHVFCLTLRMKGGLPVKVRERGSGGGLD